MSEIDPYLEQQYNNRAAVPQHPQYLQSWAQPSPVHIFIHGGYWQTLSKDSFSFVAETFNQAGECAVIVNYDLCPQVSVADIIGQLNRAVAWVIEHIHRYGGDASRIQVSGHSAGGHLVAALLTSDWSALSLAGKPLQHPPFLRLNALSGLFQLDPLIAFNSQARLPAALVGELESDEFKRQSSELKQAWQGGLTVDYRLVPGAHHFSIVDAFVNDYHLGLAAAQ